MPAPVIDAHHHLWHYSQAEYGWIDDSMRALQHDFNPSDMQQAMHSARIDAAICVQARQSLEETHWLLAQAKTSNSIIGVVGWAPLAQDDLAGILEPLLGCEKFVGLRHIVQTEPPGFLDGEAFNRGIRHLTAIDLPYDLLIHAGQLEEATRFVDRHPRQRFALDHCAKPRIAEGLLDPWRRQITELAKRGNVTCKISGLVTEADWSDWSLVSLSAYLDIVFQAFGAERCMAGSDWPVLLTASTYARWWQTLRAYASRFSISEQAALFGGTANRFYGLNLSASQDAL